MMSEAYGYKWASQFGEQPTATWVGALVGITGQQVADALKKCTELHPTWPPGAIEFRALCEGIDPRNLDKDGIDVSHEHRLIERADRERREFLVGRSHRLQDKGYQEKNRKVGAETLDQIKSIL